MAVVSIKRSIATHDSVIDSRSEWFRLSDLFSSFLCKGFHYLTNLVLFTLQLKKMKGTSNENFKQNQLRQELTWFKNLPALLVRKRHSINQLV